MDQKNTIVKCAKHKCLFNNCGTCDQYVITIGVDNTCQAYTETEGFTFKEQKVCHPDCIHFDDSDIMIGPICLFNHPEPLKKFYEGMPCDYYHSTNYTRGQRAKCNFYEDGWIDPEIMKEVCQPFTMKIAEFNKPNKNKRIIKIPSMSKEDREIMNDIGYVPPTYSHYDDGGKE